MLARPKVSISLSELIGRIYILCFLLKKMQIHTKSALFSPLVSLVSIKVVQLSILNNKLICLLGERDEV